MSERKTYYELEFEGKINEHGQMCTLSGKPIPHKSYTVTVYRMEELPALELLSLLKTQAKIKIVEK